MGEGEKQDTSLDEMAAQLRQTSNEDQYRAALETMATRVAHYFVTLIYHGVGPSQATVLAVDYQRVLLGIHP
jgi:hypothetical protein